VHGPDLQQRQGDWTQKRAGAYLTRSKSATHQMLAADGLQRVPVVPQGGTDGVTRQGDIALGGWDDRCEDKLAERFRAADFRGGGSSATLADTAARTA